ncbi:MAG TPA: efflux RND transporter periplasmic adaptor subunit [Bacteroidota bacterium]|nr:efflux RND transporter periplasmic adaptor subunit [Bacteroidota bacterium]
MENKKRKIIIWGSIVVLGLIVLGVVIYRGTVAAKAIDARRQMMPIVKVEKVARKDLPIRLQLNADVLAIRQATLIAKVGGTLERNLVDMGSFVKTNDILAVIDSTELYQTYQQTQATYIDAKLVYGRTKQLTERQLASQQDIDNAEAAMLVAKANFDAAKTKLSYAMVIAPFAGCISKRFLDPGAVVTPSATSLFTIVALDSVLINVSIPEKDVETIYHVKKASITLDALPGQVFEGAITRFSNALDVSNRTMAVQICIPNRSHILKPGMFATVTMIEAVHSQVIAVPTNILVKDADGMCVFVVQDGKAKRLPVQTGVEVDSQTEILSGLSGTESIIVTGQQTVRNGASVLVQQ